MTIATTDNSVYYTGNGATVSFSFTFVTFDANHIVVSIDGVEQGSGFTINLNPDQVAAPGGSVDFSSAPANGAEVAIVRTMPFVQEIDYTPFDAFPAETHERGLDYLTLLCQQLLGETARIFGFSDTVSDVGVTKIFASASDRASKILSFDASGDLISTQEIGEFTGDWTASTLYTARDIFKDPSNDNIYIVTTAHTSTADIADSISNSALIVDAAAAAASAAAAAASASDAAISESNAAASEAAAATSESNAATSEVNAAASAAAASTSETNAAASASLAEDWAESPTEPGGPGSKSAKTWAGEAASSVGSAVQTPARNGALNQDPISQTTGTRTGMSSTTYTGNGATQSVNTGVDMATGDLGGLVWLKSRSQPTSHNLTDTVRGVNSQLETDDTAAETTNGITITSFNSDGFSIGANTNINTDTATYVAWSFQTNQKTTGTTNRNKPYTAHYNADMGFSIVGYEGDSAAGHEIPHFLGAEPELRITKNRDQVTNWIVESPLFPDQFLVLNDSLVLQTDGTVFSEVTETTMTVGTGNANNANANDFIAYHFRSVPGVSKIGKYIGTGAAGNYVDCGFKVGFLLVKNLTTSGSWQLQDISRGFQNTLSANTSSSESTTNQVDVNETGFFLLGTSGSWNALNDEYLFIAFADSGSGSTTYEYPLTDDQLAVNANTLLSFANGFNSVGEVNTQEQVGAGVTATLGAGFENKHLWMYKDKAGSYGFSEYRPLEGITRNDADKWGVESPTDPSLRTTAKHFDYESATGVASASSEASGFEAYNAFDKDSNDIPSTWKVSSGTTGRLVMKFDESRRAVSYRLRNPATLANSPVTYKYLVSHNGNFDGTLGVDYFEFDSQTAITPEGASLWNNLITPTADSTSYQYHAIDVTAIQGAGTLEITEVEFNTILPSDYYLVNEGQMYNSSDVAIERIYLAEIRTGGSGDVTFLRNLPVAKTKGDSAEFQGDVTVHGELKNRLALSGFVNFDGVSNPPLIRDSYGITDVVDLGTGAYKLIGDGAIDFRKSCFSATTGTFGSSVTNRDVNVTNVTKNTVQVNSRTSVENTAIDQDFITILIAGGKEII